MAATPLPNALPLPLPASGGALAERVRRLAVLALAAGGVVAAVLVVGGPADAFTDALRRAAAADPVWIAVALACEALSFAGYAALLWHVASRGGSRLGPGASLQVSLAGAAATRLLPTAGVGGAALTLWSLQRAGQPGHAGVRALLTFLVLLYAVFLGAIVLAGLLVAGGLGGADGPVALAIVPAVLAGAAIAAAVWLAWGRPPAAVHAAVARSGVAAPIVPGSPIVPAARIVPAAPGRVAAALAAARRGAALLPESIRDAAGLLRRPDVRLLGAPAWWAFDLAVLWATFAALGAPPPLAVLALAYLVGQVANTIPLPGAVSGGTVGVLLAFGTASGLAIAAVLAYRAIAIWVPGTAGTAALAGLRTTVASTASPGSSAG